MKFSQFAESGARRSPGLKVGDSCFNPQCWLSKPVLFAVKSSISTRHFRCLGCFTAHIHQVASKKWAVHDDTRSPLGNRTEKKGPTEGPIGPIGGGTNPVSSSPKDRLTACDRSRVACWRLHLREFCKPLLDHALLVGTGLPGSFMPGLLHPHQGVAIGCCI